jgi:hypothetical protein
MRRLAKQETQVAMPNWSKAPIDLSSRNKAVIKDVLHTAHIETACRILRDGRITTRMVEGSKRLQSTRISATWASANYFPDSVYGCTQFAFDFKEMLVGRELYWLEADYRNQLPIYRFTLCNAGATLANASKPYDPIENKGPVRYLNNDWWFNTDVVVEFVIDSDLLLSNAKQIGFVQHDQRCRYGRSNCPDRGILSAKQKAHVLAFILANEIDNFNEAFVDPVDYPRPGRISQNLMFAAHELLRELGGWKADAYFSGKLDQASYIPALKGALSLFAGKNEVSSKEITRQFSSNEDLTTSLEEIISHHFAQKFRFID